MLKISGLDKVIDKLNDLKKKADAMNGQSIPVTEVLTSAFLTRHTPFGSAVEMCEASGFKIETKEDFEAVPDDEWDAFIRAVSGFDGWQAMLGAASKEWAAKQMSLK
ncbi:MAG: hypothetical protein JWR21_2605 [Herminiimonas sp.]|nr:hypothetical protein [Herminiimonas sp.]